jgi:hypothetical protein
MFKALEKVVGLFRFDPAGFQSATCISAISSDKSLRFCACRHSSAKPHQPAEEVLMIRSRAVVIGGATLDILGGPAAGRTLVLETSNPGEVRQYFGGILSRVCFAMPIS